LLQLLSFFYGNSDYTFKENLMTNHVSSITDTHNFSTGLVVNLPECVESLKGAVDLFGNCRDKDRQDDKRQSLALGHEVYAKKKLESNSLDIGFLNRGVYVVKAETSRGLVTERIVK